VVGIVLRVALSAFTVFLLSPPAVGSEKSNMTELSDRGLEILSAYLSINTSNPPGNELSGAKYLGEILSASGIQYQILQSAPGRANLYAKLEGEQKGGAVALLHHIDVVPADEENWSAPPFGGELREGFIWGRGVVDMKGLGIVHLMTFLALNETDSPLQRDVIFLATADEEAGSRLGLTWVLDNHFDLLADVELVLTEGGSNLVVDDELAFIGIEVAQKVPLWLRLSVKGPPGHASVPYGHSAGVRLVKALERILGYESPIILEPIVLDYLSTLAPFQPEHLRDIFVDLRKIQVDAALLASINPYHRALIQNTVSLTRVEFGSTTNVVSSTAVAELDCRLLPSQDVELFAAELERLIGDPAVRIERLLSFNASGVSENAKLFELIREVATQANVNAVVAPSVLPGFTDSHQFRERGISAFGFSPFMEHSLSGAHGPDERMSIKDFRGGLAFFHSVVSRLVDNDKADQVVE
jgi:acetylornithine deacetylase/succinyl-diaminopimelate desuccinylase-like protein